jgi:hypothetical protein
MREQESVINGGEEEERGRGEGEGERSNER